MPKYTGPNGEVIDTGDVTIEDMQAEALRLKNHNNALIGEKRAATEKAQELTSKVSELETAIAGFDTKLGEATTALAAKDAELVPLKANASKAEKLTAELTRVSVDSIAQSLAAKTKSPELMLPHIKSRLQAEIDEASLSVKTVILDKDGKPSALTPDDLYKEFAANPVFAPVMSASQARGGPARVQTPPAGGQTPGALPSLQEQVAARKAARAAQ